MKKAFIAIAAAVLIILPLTLALILYKPPISDNPDGPGSVSSIKLTDKDGREFTITDSQEIELLVKLVSATEEASAPLAVFEFPYFKMECTGDNLSALYTVYMSKDSPEEVYFTDSKGVCRKGDALSARSFMETPYAVSLYNTAPPVLTVGGASTVTPHEISWNYVHTGGGYHPVSVPVSDKTVTIDNVPKTLDLQFSVPPTSAIITVTEDGVAKAPRLLSDFTGISTSESKFFDITVTAEWNTGEGVEAYGYATYMFTVFVRADAIFDITSEVLDQGEIAVLGAKNASADTLEITVEPEGIKYFTVQDGELCRILLATDYNTPAGDYTVNVKCLDVTQSYTVKVTEHTFSKKTFDNELSVIQSVLSEENRQQLQSMIDSVMALTPIPAPAWQGEKMRFPTENQDYTTGWGITMTVSATEEVFRHLGIDCRATDGEELYAALSGTVVYTGKTEIWGGVVVIDHGAGLKTWYGRVDHTLVSAGQTVKQGDLIAKGSDTGFGDSRRMHFSVSFGNTFVNPIPLIENGIPQTELY